MRRLFCKGLNSFKHSGLVLTVLWFVGFRTLGILCGLACFQGFGGGFRGFRLDFGVDWEA